MSAKVEHWMYESTASVVPNEEDGEATKECEEELNNCIGQLSNDLKHVFTAELKHGIVRLAIKGEYSIVCNRYPQLDPRDMLENIARIAAAFNCHCEGELIVTDEWYPSHNIVFFFEDGAICSKKVYMIVEENRQCKKRIADLEDEVRELKRVKTEIILD